MLDASHMAMLKLMYADERILLAENRSKAHQEVMLNSIEVYHANFSKSYTEFIYLYLLFLSLEIVDFISHNSWKKFRLRRARWSNYASIGAH